MSDNVFTDPRTSDTYTWARNHDPEGADQSGLARSIEHSATTSGTGVVRQQGAEQPMTLTRTGLILTAAHHNAMVAWAKLGGAQTIYFADAGGDSFEVLVTGFRSAEFNLGPAIAWHYTLEMEVVTVLSGTWASTDTTP